MVSFGTNTCKSANMADHVSGTSKYYTVSTCALADTHVHMHGSDNYKYIIGRNITLKVGVYIPKTNKSTQEFIN